MKQGTLLVLLKMWACMDVQVGRAWWIQGRGPNLETVSVRMWRTWNEIMKGQQEKCKSRLDRSAWDWTIGQLSQWEYFYCVCHVETWSVREECAPGRFHVLVPQGDSTWGKACKNRRRLWAFCKWLGAVAREGEFQKGPRWILRRDQREGGVAEPRAQKRGDGWFSLWVQTYGSRKGSPCYKELGREWVEGRQRQQGQNVLLEVWW